jgi:hypothetical protein
MFLNRVVSHAFLLIAVLFESHATMRAQSIASQGFECVVPEARA